MTDEQRLQATTEMLILVRDNLFRGMSKSIQKLQARSINEFLELPNYTESPQRTWVGLTDEEINAVYEQAEVLVHDSWVGSGTVGLMFPITLYKMFEAKLKERNNGR